MNAKLTDAERAAMRKIAARGGSANTPLQNVARKKAAWQTLAKKAEKKIRELDAQQLGIANGKT